MSSTSPPVLYLDDPWLFRCFFFSDRLANGSILSTNVPPDDILTFHDDLNDVHFRVVVAVIVDAVPVVVVSALSFGHVKFSSLQVKRGQ